VVVERPDGSRITVLVNITALKDATGTVTGAINCFHDISERKQVENQLRVSENELADFFDNVSVPLHLVAQDGTIVRANDAELELLGFAREDYVGRNIVEFHVDHSTIDDILTRLRRGEKLSKYPSKLRAKDGSIKDVEISSSARFVNGEFVNTRCCTVDVTRRQELERAWRGSQADLSAELEATQLLQAVATELIHDQEPTDRLYHKLAEAAAAILRSDFASMQMLYPERGTGGELRLLASRGFDPEAVKFWEWVRADSGCTCGEALRTRKRAIASDVETCPFMAGTADREAYLQAGMGAAQSTPLISRDGRLIGMLSTHWRQPHYPSESELRRFDILARQAADVVERARTTEALRESEARLRAQVEGPVHRPR
jgi:PAS domain S-box-containing protein